MDKQIIQRIEDKFNFSNFYIKIFEGYDKNNKYLPQAKSILDEYWKSFNIPIGSHSVVTIVAILKDKIYSKNELFLNRLDDRDNREPLSVIGAGVIETDNIVDLFCDKAIKKEKSVSLDFLLTVPKYNTVEHFNRTKLRGVGSSILKCAREYAKELGVDLITLNSVNDDSIVQFYAKHYMGHAGETNFLSYTNKELLSMGVINANIIDYMIKNNISKYDDFLNTVKLKHLDTAMFMHGVENYPYGVLKAMFEDKNNLKSPFILQNRQIIDDLFVSPHINNCDCIKNYIFALYAYYFGKTNKLIKGIKHDEEYPQRWLKQDDYNSLANFQSKHLHSYRYLSKRDIQDIKIYLPLTLDTCKNMSTSSISTHIQVLKSTYISLSAKQNILEQE